MIVGGIFTLFRSKTPKCESRPGDGIPVCELVSVFSVYFLSMSVHSGRGDTLQPSLLFLLCPIILLLLLGSPVTEQLVTPQHLNPKPPAARCQQRSLSIVFLFCLLSLCARFRPRELHRRWQHGRSSTSNIPSAAHYSVK